MDDQQQDDIRRFFLIAFAVAAIYLLSFTSQANAGDWMFRRSYHTHAVPQEFRRQYPLPESRSAYRPAIVGSSYGISIQSGYRIHRVFLRSGNSTDTTILREAWIRVR